MIRSNSTGIVSHYRTRFCQSLNIHLTCYSTPLLHLDDFRGWQPSCGDRQAQTWDVPAYLHDSPLRAIEGFCESKQNKVLPEHAGRLIGGVRNSSICSSRRLLHKCDDAVGVICPSLGLLGSTLAARRVLQS